MPGESHGQRSLASYSPWGCIHVWKWKKQKTKKWIEIMTYQITSGSQCRRGGGGAGNRALTGPLFHKCKTVIWKGQTICSLKVRQNVLLQLVLFAPKKLQFNSGYHTQVQELCDGAKWLFKSQLYSLNNLFSGELPKMPMAVIRKHSRYHRMGRVWAMGCAWIFWHTNVEARVPAP